MAAVGPHARHCTATRLMTWMSHMVLGLSNQLKLSFVFPCTMFKTYTEGAGMVMTRAGTV